MAFVVCEPCRDCKYTDCVTVCPCDCFYEDDSMLYIDPEHCIDCEACVPECPVEAIFHDSTVPAPWTQFIQLNLRARVCPENSDLSQRRRSRRTANNHRGRNRNFAFRQRSGSRYDRLRSPAFRMLESIG